MSAIRTLRLGRAHGSDHVRASISVATIATLLVLWEVLPNVGVVDEAKYPALSSTVQTLWRLVTQEDFGSQVGATMVRFLGGAAVGTLLGLVLGGVLGMTNRVRMMLQPSITVLYTTPRVALFPIIVIWLGLNETAVWVMVAAAPLFVMVIATIEGIRNVSRTHLEVARSFGCSQLFTIRHVIMPAALRFIMAGFKISIGVALFATIAVEFLFENNGLGYFVWHSWGIIQMDNAMAGVVTAAALGIVSFGLATLLEKVVIRWRP